MKNFVVILMAGILLFSSAKTPAQWVVQQSNLPADVRAYRISAVNDRVAWAAGMSGALGFKTCNSFTRTVDGGEHWIAGTIPLPAGFFITNISACSADTAWAAVGLWGSSAKAGIYKTEDGGKTWKQQNTAWTLPATGPAFVHFFNALDGLAVGDVKNGYHSIVTSSNGGTIWERVPDANNIPVLPSEQTSIGMFTVSGNCFYFGAAYGSSGRIFKSSDRGKTWTVCSTGFTTPENIHIMPAFNNNLKGLAVASYGSNHQGIARTSDGGQSWSHVSSPEVDALWTASIPGIDDAYVVSGGYWGVLKTGSAFTTDHGTTWTMIDNLPHLIPEFVDQTVGWSGDGDSNTIYKWSIGQQASIGRYPLSALKYGALRLGLSSEAQSVSITNYGKDALTISEIIKPGENFHLVNPPALPMTLATLQSLKLNVRFSPQTEAACVDSFVVVSNAGNASRLGIKLEGAGLKINRVQSDVLYAISLSSLYTIDRTTGKATLVAPLDVSQVQGLVIHPSTQELIGLTTTNSNMTLHTIDCQTGKSQPLQNIPLGSTRAIAFKSDTLYGASVAGKLYRIDLATGSAVNTGTAPNIAFYSLSVNPITGQLYASARSSSSSEKDKILTVNTANGDTALVGATGDNALTPSIAFSPSGMLYGLKGTGTTENTLITIDPKTGVATLVGSTGVSGLQALAISAGTTAVKERMNDPVLPEKFVLSQNYPNPFNPSTTIEFSLQAPEQVSLKVYSILGHELAELIHDTLPAGAHKTVWNAKDCANGIYYIVLEANGCREVRKAVLMK